MTNEKHLQMIIQIATMQEVPKAFSETIKASLHGMIKMDSRPYYLTIEGGVLYEEQEYFNTLDLELTHWLEVPS
ncbi:hypothetical protein [Virgibacillus sp. LDC-1]|uniref:hypothetical protein n=1 Tax=Virgibacillus sp. LDC-1 TaxID=3039856 RepID=UPI0024DEFBF6|nr:hypothetical protein [Virgibacillus sp. LDC-1]